jgi:hypothetical protein
MKIRSEPDKQNLVQPESVNSISGSTSKRSPTWRISRKPLSGAALDADVFGTGSGDNGGCGSNGPALSESFKSDVSPIDDR